MDNKPIVFALNQSRDLGEQVVRDLSTTLSEHEERDFEDGEHKVRSLTNVRNRSAFVISSLHGDPVLNVNDKLCRLLFFVGSLKDAGAREVTVIVPYLCYSRKDRKTKSRDPVTTKYVAQLFGSVGTDRIITLDIHNLQAYQNAFRISNIHLEASSIFAGHVKAHFKGKDISVMSPDFGAAKNAEKFRRSLCDRMRQDIPFVIMEKQRSNDVVTGDKIVGEVKGRNVVIIDDMICSGGTILRAAKACLELGATSVIAIATHAAFSEKANDNLLDNAISEVIVTDSIPLHRVSDELKAKTTVLESAGLFAGVIRDVFLGTDDILQG